MHIKKHGQGPMLPILGNNRGAALVYLIGVILVMSILGAAMLNLSTTSVVGQVSANHTERAYFIAEAGINYALPLIKADIESDAVFNDDDGLHNQTFVLDEDGIEDGQFTIRIDDSDSQKTIIMVTGTIDTNVSAPASASQTLILDKVITEAENGLVDSPIFSDGKMEIGENCVITGDIGTNGAEIIKKDGVQIINGSEETHADKTLSSIDFTCSGCTDEHAISDEALWSSDDILKYNKLEINEKAKITISGDVVLKIKEDFIVKEKVDFTLLEGASLTVYADKKVEFGEKVEVRFDSGSPTSQSFVIYGTRNADSIILKEKTDFTGVIYAPDAVIEIKEKTDFTGAMVGQEVKIEKKSTITWDAGAASVTDSGGGGSGGGGEDTATLSGPVQRYSN